MGMLIEALSVRNSALIWLGSFNSMRVNAWVRPCVTWGETLCLNDKTAVVRATNVEVSDEDAQTHRVSIDASKARADPPLGGLWLEVNSGNEGGDPGRHEPPALRLASKKGPKRQHRG